MRAFNVTLPAQQPYAALSYEWGPPSPVQIIRVNGIEFHTQPNLHSFLRQLRNQLRDELPLVLWADAICIDQHSMIERNHQVTMMQQIYSEANEVLVWLGEEADSSTELFEFLNSWLRMTDVTEWPADRSPYGPEAEEVFLAVSKDADLSTFWGAVEQLSKRSYWTRVWVVQEITLPKHHRIFAGRCHVEHGALRLLYVLLSQGSFAKVNKVDGSLEKSSMYIVMENMMAQRRHGSMTYARIWYLITSFSKSECTILHDKVYGFLGMAVDARNFVVNYDKDMLQLLLQIIASEPGLSVPTLRHILEALHLGPSNQSQDRVAFLAWATTFHGAWTSEYWRHLKSRSYCVETTSMTDISAIRQLKSGNQAFSTCNGKRYYIQSTEMISNAFKLCYVDHSRLVLMFSGKDDALVLRLVALRTYPDLDEQDSSMLSIFTYQQFGHIFDGCTEPGSCEVLDSPKRLLRLPVSFEWLMMIVTAEPWKCPEPLAEIFYDLPGFSSIIELKQVWPLPEGALFPGTGAPPRAGRGRLQYSHS
jgi:hypothetical protein